jgi:uroporphyrin-3 C-methyltransferase
MSEQVSQREDEAPDQGSQEAAAMTDQPRTGHKTSVADVFSRISITQLTLTVLVVIFLWQWLDGHREISDMQQQLAKKIAEMDGNSKANQLLLAQDQDQVRELSNKVATMESRYAETQNQRAALEYLYNNLSANRDEAALAEVEQMLLSAEQYLQLTYNVRAALIAMQSADERLQRMNRPAFGLLRQAISRDMDKLRALHDVDITGANIKLNNLIAIVDQMPLSYQQREINADVAQTAPPKDETSWRKLLREIWQEVKQLVRIDNTDKAEIPLLPPNQEFFLRENLKLSLLSARLALLSRDEASFKQGLMTSQLWTARYFDGKSSEVKQMSDGLKKLAASDISIELPDISASLKAVRNYRLMRDNETKTGIVPQPKVSTKGRTKAAK